MGKCSIIGTIRIPANVGQAVRVNGKKCDEETVWDLVAYGGESHSTDFTLENRSNVDFNIEWTVSTASDGEYTAGIYESDGTTPVTSPQLVSGKETKNWKFKVDFDKYITEDTYEIVLEFDFE